MNNFYDSSLLNNNNKFDWRPLLYFVIGFVLEVIGQSLFYFLTKTTVSTLTLSISWLGGKLFALVFMVIAMKDIIINSSKNYRKYFKQFLIITVIAFAFFYLISLGTSYYEIFIEKFISDPIANQSGIQEYFLASKTPLNYVILGLTIVILAPALEELEYRAVFFNAFKNLPWWVVALISAFCFSLPHLLQGEDFNAILKQLAYFPVYFIPGLGLALIYHYSGNNFWASFACHSAYNLIGFIQLVIYAENYIENGIPV